MLVRSSTSPNISRRRAGRRSLFPKTDRPTSRPARPRVSRPREASLPTFLPSLLPSSEKDSYIPQPPRRDDHPLRLRRALVDLGGAHVAEEPLDGGSTP